MIFMSLSLSMLALLFLLAMLRWQSNSQTVKNKVSLSDPPVILQTLLLQVLFLLFFVHI